MSRAAFKNVCFRSPSPYPSHAFETFSTSHANAKRNVKRKTLCLRLVGLYLQCVLHKITNNTVVSFRGILESALWSHVCIVVVVVEDPPKVARSDAGSIMESCLSWCVDPPPRWLTLPPPPSPLRDGWLVRLASTLTKRTCLLGFAFRVTNAKSVL